MGRITVPKDAKWETAEMQTDNFNDENFAFLAAFEEILPDETGDISETENKVKKKKDKEVKYKKTEEDAEEKPVEVTDEERRRLKKKRRKQQMALNRQKRRERIARRKLKEPSTPKPNEVNAEEKVPANTIKDEEEEERRKKTKRKATANENNTKKLKIDGEKNGNKETGISSEDSIKKVDISAWTRFQFLPSEVLDAIVDLGFSEPTEIQQLVLPKAIRDRLDVLGAAETGSGKTLAFAIPVVCRLLQQDEMEKEQPSKSKGPKALIIAPTRELCIQIMSHLRALIKYTSFNAECIVGGLAQPKQERILKKLSPEIIVATPGRLWAMMKDADVDSYFGNLEALRCLVVDETDRMVEEGYFDELTDILLKVHEESNREKLQTLIFSATLTFSQDQDGSAQPKKTLSPEQKIQRLIKLTGLREGKRAVLDVTRKVGTAGGLVEARINCSDLLDKDASLVYLLSRYTGRTLVFVNSVDAARRLHGILSALKICPLLLHAKMIQRQRLRSLEKFTASTSAVLLATDVAARGLDIKGIDHVVHYQVPKTPEMYIHRSGRTARASHRGLTVLLVDPPSRALYVKLCRKLNRMEDLVVFPIDSEPLMDALRRRVKIASEIDSMSFRCKKIRMAENWFEKMARDADLDYDDNRSREMEGSNVEVDQMKNKEAQLRAQLAGELEKPLPRHDGTDSLRTRYITPQIVAQISSKADSAIDVLHEKIAEAKEWKKRARKLIPTSDVKSSKINRR